MKIKSLIVIVLFLSISFSTMNTSLGLENYMNIQNSVETIGLSSDTDEIDIIFYLEDLLLDALVNNESTIDISSYNLSKSDYPFISELRQLIPYLGNENITFATNYSSSIYTTLYVNNTMDIEETEEYIQKVSVKIAEIKSIFDSCSTDLEKALALHDYFVSQYEYDVDNAYQDCTDPRALSYTCGGLIMNSKAVCDGYAHAYKYFMNLTGIECYVTSSSSMDHAWNIIKIDGNYYHVDCTWDDVVPDRYGLANHNYFLLSDTAISSNHYSWDLEDEVVCNDTTYDNAYWLNVSSPIIIQDNVAYYTKYISSNSYLVAYDLESKTTTNLVSLGKWYSSGSSYYTSCYSGLFYYDGYLYYNTSTAIQRISLSTKKTETVASPDTTNGGIFGICLKDGKLKYMLGLGGTVYDLDVDFEFEEDDIIISQSSLSMVINHSKQLYASVVPSYADNQTISWSSSNKSVATVSKGYVTAVGGGTATITATTSNGLKATCKVTVSTNDIPITDITLDKSIVTFSYGGFEYSSLTATITPEDTTDSIIISWKSSDTSVVTVDSYGNLTAVNPGTATITATTSNDISATCKVIVYSASDIPITSLSISYSNTTIEAGSSMKITATVAPDNTTDDKTITWSSSNEKVATVNQNGTVTGVSAGTAKIYITTSNGISKYITITVTNSTSDSMPFVDVSSSQWYYNTVKEAYNLGLMTGTDETHFAPNKNMSRAMVVTVLYRMAGSPKVSSSSKFTDVKDGIWYTNAITWATNLGIVSGYGNGKFGPEDNVTREQMAVMLRNYCQIYKKFNTTSTNSLTSFTDYKNVSSYAKTAVGWAVDKGIITGTTTNKLNPKSKATRAECAKMLVQASKLTS